MWIFRHFEKIEEDMNDKEWEEASDLISSQLEAYRDAKPQTQN